VHPVPVGFELSEVNWHVSLVLSCYCVIIAVGLNRVGVSGRAYQVGVFKTRFRP